MGTCVKVLKQRVWVHLQHMWLCVVLDVSSWVYQRCCIFPEDKSEQVDQSREEKLLQPLC